MGDLYARSVMKREVIMQKLRRSGIKPADTVQRERGSYSTCRASASPVHQCISVLQTRQVPPPTRILVILTVSSLDRDNTVPLTAKQRRSSASEQRVVEHGRQPRRKDGRCRNPFLQRDCGDNQQGLGTADAFTDWTKLTILT